MQGPWEDPYPIPTPGKPCGSRSPVPVSIPASVLREKDEIINTVGAQSIALIVAAMVLVIGGLHSPIHLALGLADGGLALRLVDADRAIGTDRLSARMANPVADENMVGKSREGASMSIYILLGGLASVMATAVQNVVGIFESEANFSVAMVLAEGGIHEPVHISANFIAVGESIRAVSVDRAGLPDRLIEGLARPNAEENHEIESCIRETIVIHLHGDGLASVAAISAQNYIGGGSLALDSTGAHEVIGMISNFDHPMGELLETPMEKMRMSITHENHVLMAATDGTSFESVGHHHLDEEEFTEVHTVEVPSDLHGWSTAFLQPLGHVTLAVGLISHTGHIFRMDPDGMNTHTDGNGFDRAPIHNLVIKIRMSDHGSASGSPMLHSPLITHVHLDAVALITLTKKVDALLLASLLACVVVLLVETETYDNPRHEHRQSAPTRIETHLPLVPARRWAPLRFVKRTMRWHRRWA